MYTPVKVVGIAALLFLTMIVVGQGFALLSTASNMAVLGGVVILLGVLGFYAWALPKVYLRIRQMMAKWGNPMIFLAAIGTLAIVGCTNVDPGHVGIEVDSYGKNVASRIILLPLAWSGIIPSPPRCSSGQHLSKLQCGRIA